jgi:hypothetical protein
MQCKGKDVICPVNQAVYSTKVILCELSLYLQSDKAQELCGRKLFKYPIQALLE